MTTRILLWSGGPDSTAMMIDFLENTDDPVIAVHVKGDMTGGPVGEDVIEGSENAVHSLYPILRDRYRSFDLKVFSHEWFSMDDDEDYKGLGVFFYPITYLLNVPNSVLYLGHTREDRNDSWRKFGELDVNSYPYLLGLDIVDYNMDKPKSEIFLQLGDLWDMTWSCVGPLKERGVPCYHCNWCMRRKRAEADAKKLLNENGERLE